MCERIAHNFNRQHQPRGEQQEEIEDEKACPFPVAGAARAEGGLESKGGHEDQGQCVEEVEKREKNFQEGIVEAGSRKGARDVGVAGLGRTGMSAGVKEERL